MRINLAEVPEEGRQYLYNRQTGELNTVLQDLVGSAEYTAEFYIKPLTTKDYDLVGTIKTKCPEVCGRCGIDFPLPINAKYHEILIPKQDQPRTSKYSKVNHVSDIPESDVDTVEYEGHHFDIGEYLHEAVGLAAPFNPAGPVDDKGDCTICNIPVKGHSFSYEEVMPEEKPESPFAALKNIKLN